MLTSRSVCTGALGLLWGLALWSSWQSRGLYLDGSYYLLEAIRGGGFAPYDFLPGRAFAMWLTQLPVAAALALGAGDTHWLARLYSLGLLGLPTLLYSLALWRARHDAVLLALVIAAIALVFQTTSFFIVGEYNTAYAAAILAATLLATGGSEIILLAAAALALKTYEAFVYLGPLLAGLALWRKRPLPALLFLAAGAIAAVSLTDAPNLAYLPAVFVEAAQIWKNLPFDLLLAATIALAAWALLRPRDLGLWPPYAVAGVFLLLLALAPLLVVNRVLVGLPYGYAQGLARSGAGLVVAVFCILIGGRHRFAATPAAARNLLAFCALMLVATVPWTVMLTTIYTAYLQEVRTTIGARSGPIAFEQTRLASAPRLAQGESWSLVTLSLLLRASPQEGVIQPPKDYAGWQPPHAAGLDPRFRWRD